MKKIILLLFISQTAIAENFVLSESSLSKLSDDVPTMQQIELLSDSAKLGYLGMNDAFTPSLTASAYYSENKEKQLNRFAPITSPIKDFSVGVEKPTSIGMKLGAKVFAQQTTNSFVTSSTTTGISAELAMDLHKDFLGRITKTELDNRKMEADKADLEKKISKKAFIQNLRKLYWALVANNEAQKITKELLVTANQQVKQAEDRFKNKVADSGEVARYRSQVAARTASLISLQYQQSNLHQRLKEMIPSLASKTIVLAPYNLDETVNNVLVCSSMLEQKTNSPMDFTLYDEVVQILNGQEQNQKKIDNLYDTWDLALQSEIKKTGKEYTYSESYSDLSSDGRNAYQVGLQLTIPLGSRKKDTREVKEIVNKKKFKAEQEANLAKLEAYHSQMIRSVTLLKQVVANQKINSFNLAKSLKVSQKKYKQARITVEQLVQEQDGFLNSNLAEIETKLNIINTLLDYFSVYTETPCNLNRI
ncbi:MAG: TolC family protein [Deltaproteobacteria bacterium]|nr:MAG: TolC family protein [Deltaproteobacteria bacterium]